MDHIFKLIEQKVLQDKLNITEMILRYIVLVVSCSKWKYVHSI